MLKSFPPWQREARSRGLPVLGAGTIYPFKEEFFVVNPFAVPDAWARGFALDVGWNKTAALWGAYDMSSDTVYLYSEYYVGEEHPAVHAEAIRSRGEKIPGKIDPAAEKGRNFKDGTKLMELYRDDYALNITPANNAVTTGLVSVYDRLSTSRLKVFSSLSNFLSEIRIYRRDVKGKIVKENDHLMDCVRYMCIDDPSGWFERIDSGKARARSYGWAV